MDEILFVMSRAGVASGNNQIWSISSDGSGLVRLTTTTDTTDWSWISAAADGRLLAADSSSNVWILSAAGVPVLQLTNIPSSPNAGFVQGDWSPDMTKVVIASGAFGAEKVTVVNADNSGYSVFAAASISQVVNGKLCWSPDGSKIAYPSGGSGGSDYVSVDICDASTGGAVTTLLAAAVGSTSYVPFGWYSDSTNVLVTELVEPNDAKLLKTDGTTTTVLFDNPGQSVLGSNSGSVATLSSDSTQAAWTTSSGDGLTVLDAGGATHTILSGEALATIGVTSRPGPHVTIGPGASGMVPRMRIRRP